MKRLIAITILALSVGAMLVGCSDKRPTLHIYTLADYIDPDVIQAFEDKHCCKVCVDVFDSNEAMFAKLYNVGQD